MSAQRVVRLPCECAKARRACPLCEGRRFHEYTRDDLAGKLKLAADLVAMRLEDDDLDLTTEMARFVVDVATRCAIVATLICPVEICDHDVGLCSCGERQIVDDLVAAWTNLPLVEVADRAG